MEGDLTAGEYRHLAEFRRQIRAWLHLADSTVQDHGTEPQQSQLLLALQGLPEAVNPTVSELATRLFIRHHSAVELINRLEQRGLVARKPGDADRREVWVRLTPLGRATLRKLATTHREQLQRTGPELARALNGLVRQRRRHVP